MSRIVYDGQNKVYFAASDGVDDTDAPTEAEIAGAVNFTPFVTKDGISVPSTQNVVDIGGIDTNYNAEVVGTWGGGLLTLTMFRDDTDETNSYDQIVYGTNGYLIISRFGEPEAGSQVEVWPVQMHEPTLMQSAGDEAQKFTAGFAVTAAPSMRATVAAS